MGRYGKYADKHAHYQLAADGIGIQKHNLEIFKLMLYQRRYYK